MAVKKEELIPNIEICNIALVRVDNDLLRDRFADRPYHKKHAHKPNVHEYIWIAGSHGYEGILNDGELEYWDYELDGLLKQIAAHIPE